MPSPAAKHVYFTTPIYYPSGDPHMGHALTMVLADVLKRYYTSLGYKCFLSAGTDEHGEKIYKSAMDNKMSVEKFLDQNVAKFKHLWEVMGIDYDKFVRTTDSSHKNLVKKIFSGYEAANQLYMDQWRGWYCTSCEEGYSYRSIGNTAVCKLGHPLLMRDEKTYFLKARAFKVWLTNEFKSKENWIYPEHYKKEMLNNFINDLDDLSITRTNINWGIKVPGDESHVIYVWFDGLLNYLTALNYDKPNSVAFKNFWANPETKIIQIIGKEICRFHSIYWPIMLKNLNLRMFDTLLVHGWLLFNDEKMSKSKKNVIDPLELLNIFPRDAIRFYLMKFNCFRDNQVGVMDIYEVYNGYLANTYGNLISRFYGIVGRKFNLVIPNDYRVENFIELDQLNMQFKSFLDADYENLVLQNSPFLVIEKIFDMFRSAGKLIDKNKPWDLDPDDALLRALVGLVYRILCVGTWVLKPILIDTAPVILDVLDMKNKRMTIPFFKKSVNFQNKTLTPLEKPFFVRFSSDQIL